jgi:putative membrane protein
MDIPQNSKATRKFFIVALVAATLSACSTSRQQPPAANANTNVAAAPEEAQPTAQEAKPRPAVSRAAPSAEASSEKTTVTILARIHQANLKEIAISKLAQGKASTSEIRAYADQLVQDHTNADQMVATIAQKTGAHLHENAHGKQADKKLRSAGGVAFDRLFLQQTSSDQERLIRSLQQEREDASDDDIEALIDKIMPILEQHHELAQILMKKEQA